MAMKVVLYLVAILLVLLKLNYEARCSDFSKEKLDLNEQYKILKKPSIKTIKLEYGDIYDCVDFYKQPAFDHPLLQNHTFHPQMKPSFVPKGATSSQKRMFFNSMDPNVEKCPEGTVPIKRISKNDFIKSRQFTEDYTLRIKSNVMKGVPGDHFAIMETNSGPSTVYKGARGTFSTHGGLPIKTSQYSSAGLTIRNGNDLIQVGWTINPSINNDNRPHLFQYFSAGTSHCFNTQCPGFVNIQGTPIDLPIKHVTTTGIRIRVLTFNIFKDPKDGNWWFAIDDENNKRSFIGFWPKQIFSNMADSASYVAFGGEAYGPLSERLPAMGNGFYPVNSIFYSAFCANMFVIDADYTVIDDLKTTTIFSDDSHYGVHDVRKYKYFFHNFGRVIFFGGTTKTQS